MNNTSFVLITGASAGIGKACAYALAEKKKNLILLARRKEKLEEIKKSLTAQHDISVEIYVVDLTDKGAIDKFFDQIQGKSIDVLVNNAGVALGKDSFEEYDWKDFDRMIELNIKAFTYVAQKSIPFLKETKGHIINMSSVAGVEGYEGGSVYCASKAYIRMISKALRIDLAGTGIRVTDIAPGAVKTDISMIRFKGDVERAEQVYAGYIPLFAEDIAATVVFALEQPEHVTIEQVLIMPTAQASATRVVRDK